MRRGEHQSEMGNVRYIIRRNPVKAERLERRWADQLRSWQALTQLLDAAHAKVPTLSHTPAPPVVTKVNLIVVVTPTKKAR
jgi:ABC-type protease/lipase transport system fused ATPase/permease subunit